MEAKVAGTPRRAGVHRDVLLTFLLAVFDLFAIYEAFTLAFTIREASGKPLAHYMSETRFAVLVAALSPLWLILFGAAGLYSTKLRRSRWSELGRIAGAVTVGAMVLIVFDYLLISTPIFPGRAVPVYAVPLGVVFVFACRLFVRWLISQLQRHGHALRRLVLVGSGELAQQITDDITIPGRGYRIIAVVCPRHDGEVLFGAPVFATLERAIDGREPLIDEVLQADVGIDRREVTRMMSYATSRGITYRFVPDQYGVYAAASDMTTIAGIPMMDVRLTSLDGWGAVTKRVFDVVGAVVFGILLSPVLLGIAVALKVSDPVGPIFYTQDRIGRGGVGIRIFKFRTMRWDFSTGPGHRYRNSIEAFTAMGRADLVEEFRADHKVHDDPRITRIGMFLRRTSLDELPQLINVLSGELSLIGPRPVTTDELAHYGDQVASFLALKPGLTGLWQVSGRNDVSYEERVKLDVYYAQNWSLKLDMAILARTTAAVLAKKGAY
ncbi:MAG: sugar transferase [Mycobacterium sp.]|nr:sugar transferase [Mycobacterium sp.]